MKDIWSILGIEETKDVTLIKKAYTSKAKKIDRESESEKFSELHSAYRMALDFCKRQTVFTPAPQKKEEESVPDNSPFDFGNIDTGSVESMEGRIIDDIVNFRTENHLNDMATVRMLQPGVFTMFSNTMLSMYRALALTTDDENVWESFVQEPLIENVAINPQFRKAWKSVVPPDSKHSRKIDKLCEPFEEKYKEIERKRAEHNAQLTEESNRRLKLRKKGINFLIAGVCAVVLGVPILLLSEFLVFFELVGLFVIVAGFALCFVGGFLIYRADLIPHERRY